MKNNNQVKRKIFFFQGGAGFELRNLKREDELMN